MFSKKKDSICEQDTPTVTHANKQKLSSSDISLQNATAISQYSSQGEREEEAMDALNGDFGVFVRWEGRGGFIR